MESCFANTFISEKPCHMSSKMCKMEHKISTQLQHYRCGYQDFQRDLPDNHFFFSASFSQCISKKTTMFTLQHYSPWGHKDGLAISGLCSALYFPQCFFGLLSCRLWCPADALQPSASIQMTISKWFGNTNILILTS